MDGDAGRLKPLLPQVAKMFPGQKAVERVAQIANAFWLDHPEKYIGIHCALLAWLGLATMRSRGALLTVGRQCAGAYGFNRTGFVVCAYLIQVCGLTVDQALHNFAAGPLCHPCLLGSGRLFPACNAAP